MTSEEQLELLTSAVALRVEGRAVPESIRRSLAAVEARILDLVGPLVRKRIAARLLGVSVQALDRWIARGVLPTAPVTEGSSRTALPTALVVDIAAERGHGSLAHAIEQVRKSYQRDADVRDAHNLTVAIHQIAAGAGRSIA